MNTRYVMGSTMRMAGLALCALAVFTWVFLGAFARETGREITLQQSVHSIWEEADGPIVGLNIQRSWTWGPEPLAQTTEFYSASPDGKRTLVYFDKARLDITNMNADRNSPWFATGALLVSEMLSGEIQLDADKSVSRPVPDIALTGDIDQPAPVTYEVLAEQSMFAEEAEPAESAVGSELTAVLQSSGTVDADGMSGSGVLVSEYSDTTGHNIAEPFSTWAGSMSYPDLYLLGHPVSEPYWIQTEVLGTPKMVLVQAFERRVLTYTPDNPVEWMVESANVGQHYRLWRGLEQPIDPNLVPLASLASFGEELVQAAIMNGLDPYMLVAISEVVSGGDTLHESSTGKGLLNLNGADAKLDPQENANAGAKIMRALTPVASAPDWEVILTAFYGDDDLVEETLEVYDELFERYTAELMAMSDDTVNPETFGGPLSNGPVAYYDPSYTTDWWEWALTYYDGMGLIAPGWANDPSGYYCVRPGYLPGERLRVNANGRTIDCTVGDMVADRDLGNWLSKWSIEMNWPMFVALGLDQNNMASVEYPGNTPKPPPPVTVVPQSPSVQPSVPPAPGGPSNPNPVGPQAPSVSPEAPQQPAPPPPPVVAPAPPMSEPVPTPEPEPAPAPPVVEPAPPVVEPAPAPPVVEPAPPAPPSSDGGGGSADPLPPSR